MVEHFKIACSKDNLKVIRKLIFSFLSKLPVSDIESNLMVLAVDEVCANIIIHSNKQNDDSFMDIHLKVEKGVIVFEIRDSGIGFDLVNYAEPPVSKIIETKRKGGVGIRLIKRIMDKIEYKQEKGKNLYRMYKKLDSTQSK
jgi:serine/threonine-protein kinase RsbW